MLYSLCLHGAFRRQNFLKCMCLMFRQKNIGLCGATCRRENAPKSGFAQKLGKCVKLFNNLVGDVWPKSTMCFHPETGFQSQSWGSRIAYARARRKTRGNVESKLNEKKIYNIYIFRKTVLNTECTTH